MRDDAASTERERWDAPGAPDPRALNEQPTSQRIDNSDRRPSGIARMAERLAPALALATVAGLALTGLSSFGIWDPWEIAVAEKARRLTEGQATSVTHVGPWLVSLGFRLFGVDEWSGRLPIALSGVIAAALAYPLVARFAGRRAGAYAVLIAGTSPLFLFNTRTMLGEAPAFALQTGIVASAMLALFGTGSPARATRRDPSAQPGGATARIALLVLALALACAATAARGALLGALPALGAVALVAAFEGKLLERRADPVGFASALVLCGAAAALLLVIAQSVIADRAGFSVVLGGTPQGGQPPTFEVTIERAFHAFAPWSALLPLALSRMVMAGGPASLARASAAPASGEVAALADDRPLRMLCLLWLALSYAALTLFLSRYGDEAAVFPVVAMAAAVALFLRDVERARASSWPAAIASGLLALIVVRDYSLYPSGPMHGMPLSDFTVPEVFNPKRVWAALIVTFGATTLLGLGAYGQSAKTLRGQLAAPYRLIAVQWRRGAGFKAWLLLFATLLLVLEIFGVLSWAAPKAAHLSTQAIKWGRRLVFLPAALPLAVAAAQLLVYSFAKLRELRCLPVLAAGTAIALYAAFGFMPALSSHFSPREVYETYNALAADRELLLEYKIATRAARYYAKGETRDVERMTELMDALVRDERTWVVLASEDLASVDRMFRAKTGRHLFVADARSAKMTLATNQPIPGRRDQSFLGEFVKRAPPVDIQHRVDANFDDKILLLGYDLKLPHGDHVAAGETFELTWYFKALRPVPGSYRVFVHIDANAMRIHGDHDPVDGRYPVRMWDEGDVIVDRQRIDVPPNYSAGAYAIFVGFYSGETRLVVKEGPRDDANRVRAGVLRIR